MSYCSTEIQDAQSFFMPLQVFATGIYVQHFTRMGYKIGRYLSIVRNYYLLSNWFIFNAKSRDVNWNLVTKYFHFWPIAKWWEPFCIKRWRRLDAHSGKVLALDLDNLWLYQNFNLFWFVSSYQLTQFCICPAYFSLKFAILSCFDQERIN